ncbi:MAG: ATP-binding cassette domain-containing protein [Chloroflexi bacterium]|nr:ATP-binding cassette domain-containing protein [Chloroflexota bacterium]
MQKTLLLQASGISKRFPGVQALDNVDFEVYQGEVIGLVGENGAGKSSLMKVLAGVYTPDSGTIRFRGADFKPRDPGEAQAQGISTIYQELALIPYLTVAENIFLNREPRLRFSPGLIDYSKMNAQARDLLRELEAPIPVTAQVSRLPIAAQQMIEIAKALSRSSQLIIMDEPTSSLASSDIEHLFKLIKRLTERGVSVIFIGHRLEEVLGVADRIIVMRDGERVGSLAIDEANEDTIIRLMVGRKVELYPKQATTIGEPVLEVRNLSDGKRIQDINFTVHKGEIVGLAGLIGAGRTEVARMIFGVDPRKSGQIFVNGDERRINTPVDAVNASIALVPEDRKLQGLVLVMNVQENTTLALLNRISQLLGWIPRHQEREISAEYRDMLDIQTPSLQQIIRNLSGGNQQKVVIAKWLSMTPAILILDEPTRGIDIGAKAEVHAIMSRLAAEGIGILMISSELPEIFGMSDRVLVMCDGKITGEFSREELQQPHAQELVIAAATRFSAIEANANPSPSDSN